MNNTACTSLKYGSDYCEYCGKPMLGRDTSKCEVRVDSELAKIPDSEVLAFGCQFEADLVGDGVTGVIACKTWCKKSTCPAALKEKNHG